MLVWRFGASPTGSVPEGGFGGSHVWLSYSFQAPIPVWISTPSPFTPFLPYSSLFLWIPFSTCSQISPLCWLQWLPFQMRLLVPCAGMEMACSLSQGPEVGRTQGRGVILSMTTQAQRNTERSAKFMWNFKTKHSISKKVPALFWCGGSQFSSCSLSCVFMAKFKIPGGCHLQPRHVLALSHILERALDFLLFAQNSQLNLHFLTEFLKVFLNLNEINWKSEFPNYAKLSINQTKWN